MTVMSRYIHNTQGWKSPRSRTSHKQLIKNLALLAIALGFAGSLMLVGLMAFISGQLPNPNSLTERSISQTTKIYDRTGEKVLVATLLHEELRRWVGMQIIEQKENYFVYKSISKPSFEELESMLRRTFLLLMDACDEFVKACENDDKVLLETMDQKFFNILIFVYLNIRQFCQLHIGNQRC